MMDRPRVRSVEGARSRRQPSRPPRLLLLALPLLALLPLPLAGAVAAKEARPVLRVRADPVVELLAIVFRLAGSPEYSTAAEGSPGRAAIDARFARHEDHPAVALARRLRSERGISHDAVVSLAVHINNIRNFSLVQPLEDAPRYLDARWDAPSASAFIEQLRDFATETAFDDWWDDQREVHEALTAPLLEGLVAELDLPWFRNHLGLRIDGTLEVIVSPAAGGSAYSVSAEVERRDGAERVHHVILGAMGKDLRGEARIRAVDTIVHELCHPTVNPAVDARVDLFREARSTLEPPIALAMEEQGYGEWSIVLREVFVRLFTRAWILEHRGARAAETYDQEQTARSFALVSSLAEEEATRLAGAPPAPLEERIAAFAPAIDRIAREQARELEPHRPRVLRVEPGIECLDLAPGPITLRITFDRPMEAGFNVMRLRAPFPEVTGSAGWTEDRRVFSVPLKVAAGVRYELGVNGPGGGAFRAAETGVPLIPFRVILSSPPPGGAPGAEAPRVVRITPSPEGGAVAPGETELRLEFDRRMAESYSVTGGGETFPEVTGAPRWNEERTVFTLPIRLVAGRSYLLGINGPNHSGFRSEAGVPVEPRTIRLTVGSP
jgi:hypothetical protein